MTSTEQAKYRVGDRLYFRPSPARKPFGAAIAEGAVIVTQVVDHGSATPYAPRFSYVVRALAGGGQQGTDDRELSEPESAAEPVTAPGPIDRAAVTARRIDSLLNSGAVDPEPTARSVCRYCGLVVETDGDPDAADAEWTSPAGPGLTGRRRECYKAPNPTDGPMPDHAPGVIARRPR